VNTNGLTFQEIASGLVFGFLPGERLDLRSTETPRQAMEGVILAALQHPPCLVTFSGGFDSSAVLSVATHVARRESLEPPIPLTWRFPFSPESGETEYQEATIRALRLDDWVLHEPGDTFDLLGEMSLSAHRRYGLLFPSNLFAHVPAIEQAAGGALLTGIGGDQVLAGHRYRSAAYMLTGTRPPSLGALRTLLVAKAPRAVRLRRIGRSLATRDWLTPEAWAITRRQASMIEPHELWYRDNLRQIARHRYLEVLATNLSRIAADHDVVVRHPLMDARFLSALASDRGDVGYGGRIRALTEITGDVLNEAVLTRTTKAVFTDVFWRPQTRQRALRLPVELLDSAVVNRDRLRTEWDRPQPHASTALLAIYLTLAAESA
jgi:hypothetical protein